jgi:hypothetical protein
MRYSRKVWESVKATNPDMNSQLCSHTFERFSDRYLCFVQRNLRGQSGRRGWKLSALTQLLVTVTIVINAGGYLYAISAEMYELEQIGLSADMLDEGNPLKSKSWSLVGLGLAMREASPDTSRAWINIFVAIYFLLLLVAPALWFFGCLYLWVVPMRPRERHHLIYLTRFGWAPSPLEVAGRVRDTSATRPRHVLQAYSTPEVFILTIGTALVPLGPVLKQMLMDKRDTIDAAIYQYFGDLVDVPTIFGMSRTRLKPPFFIFLAVTFIGVYLGIFVLELAVSANRDVYSAPPRREQSPHDGDVDSGPAYSEASGASRGTAAGQRHARDLQSAASSRGWSRGPAVSKADWRTRGCRAFLSLFRLPFSRDSTRMTPYDPSTGSYGRPASERASQQPPHTDLL